MDVLAKVNRNLSLLYIAEISVTEKIDHTVVFSVHCGGFGGGMNPQSSAGADAALWNATSLFRCTTKAFLQTNQ